MAIAFKSARTLVASVSLPAGNTVTGTIDITTALGLLLVCRITNSGTGPGVGCSVTINVSNDNASWRQMYKYTAGLIASTNYDFVVEIPEATMYLQVSFTGNTSQPVTIEATGQELTSIS